MEAFIYKKSIRKFKCLLKGFIFGMISLIALALCLYFILNGATSPRILVLMLFGISIISLILGFVGMLRDNQCYQLKRRERIV